VSVQDHRPFEDDLAAWVLGALDEREAEALERHLAGCERCRADLRWLRPAVDALPAAVTQIAPPPRLRSRLLGIVRTEARRRASASLARGRWRSWLPMPRPAVAALAATALIVAGVLGYALRGGDDTSTFQATPSPAAPRAQAELVVEDGAGTLHARGLPPLKGNREFQAWVSEEGRAGVEPSTVFRPNSAGHATAPIPGLENADQVLVTSEPKGGSTHPTTPPLLRAKLS
jgi:anti-sigma-K factor RskA